MFIVTEYAPLRSLHRMGIFFGVAKISNIFFWVLEIPDIFGVKGRCWVRAYVCRKIESTPPPPGDEFPGLARIQAVCHYDAFV